LSCVVASHVLIYPVLGAYVRGYAFTESNEGELMKTWFFSAIAASFNKTKRPGKMPGPFVYP